MKWLLSVVFVFVVVATTACGARQPAPTSTPPTSTPVIPTVTIAFTPTPAPTPTATPMPEFDLGFYFRNCWYQRVYVGQSVFAVSGVTSKLVEQFENWVKSPAADVKITIDDNDPIVINDPVLWTNPQLKNADTAYPYYSSDFRWKLPDLPEGKHLIVIAQKSPQSAFEGQSCATLFVVPPGRAYETNQLIVRRNAGRFMLPQTGCYGYTVAEADQPLTLIDSGQGDSVEGRIQNYINASVVKIWIDDAEPVVVSGKDGWGPIYNEKITYDYVTEWSFNLPILSKGSHHIKVEWDVSYKVTTDSPSNPMTPEKPVQTGCVDVTVQ